MVSGVSDVIGQSKKQSNHVSSMKRALAFSADGPGSYPGKRVGLNFERAVGGSILTAGKKFESEKSACNNSGYKLTGLTGGP